MPKRKRSRSAAAAAPAARRALCALLLVACARAEVEEWESCSSSEDVSVDMATQDVPAPFKARAWTDAITPRAARRLQREARVILGWGESSWWVPASLAAEKGRVRTGIEAFALKLFALHAKRAPKELRESPKSGCEVWVQYADPAVKNIRPKDFGVHWHFDKDENLRDDYDVYFHPHVATVTYLTSGSTPTLIIDRTCEADGGTVKGGDRTSDYFVSKPLQRKHLAFAGNLLHAVPSQLNADGTEVLRMTLLVNVWLGHRPLGLKLLTNILAATSEVSANPVVRLSKKRRVEWGQAPDNITRDQIHDAIDVPLPSSGQFGWLMVGEEQVREEMAGRHVMTGEAMFKVGELAMEMPKPYKKGKVCRTKKKKQ